MLRQTRRTTRVAVPRYRSLRAAMPPAPMASLASHSTPRMGSCVQRVLQTSCSKGACGAADIPQVPPLACAGERHVLLPQEASLLGAAELSVFKAVRARRLCDENSVRLRAGGLARGSHHLAGAHGESTAHERVCHRDPRPGLPTTCCEVLRERRTPAKSLQDRRRVWRGLLASTRRARERTGDRSRQAQPRPIAPGQSCQEV